MGLFATPWTVAHQAPLSMEFSRQEYWRGCHSFFQGIFLTQGLNLGLLHCRQILFWQSYKGSYHILAHPQLLWTIENVIGSWKITKIWEKRKSWGRIEWQGSSPTWGHSFKAGRGCCFNYYRSQDRVKYNEETGIFPKWKNNIKPWENTLMKVMSFT